MLRLADDVAEHVEGRVVAGRLFIVRRRQIYDLHASHEPAPVAALNYRTFIADRHQLLGESRLETIEARAQPRAEPLATDLVRLADLYRVTLDELTGRAALPPPPIS